MDADFSFRKVGEGKVAVFADQLLAFLAQHEIDEA
jgi:hypothetical protein